MPTRKTLTAATIFQGALLCALLNVIAAAEKARTITIRPGAQAQKRLQTALIEAQPGDVIELAAGRFEFNATLSLDVSGVTVRGAGADQTVLSFKDLLQGTGGEGLLVTAGGFTL